MRHQRTRALAARRCQARRHRTLDVWENTERANAFCEVGVTLFQTELTSDDGYDLTSLKQAVAYCDEG